MQNNFEKKGDKKFLIEKSGINFGDEINWERLNMATNRAKAVAKKILLDPSKEVGEAMREVGYSENTRPHDLTNTKAWQELMDEYLPDDKVLETHQAGLEATKTSNAAILLTKDGKMVKAEEQGLIEVPDHAVRLKAVELAYKVKKKLQNDDSPSQTNIQINVDKYIK